MADTPTSNTSTLWRERGTQDHVIVAQAENDFGQVQQSLTTPKIASKVAVQDSDSIDLEKGREKDRQETFDLREYLTSSNDANSAAGIKHKHVGVTWEDLEVTGIGGDDNKVRSFVRCPAPSVSLSVFARSTCLLTQVGIFTFFFRGLLLTYLTDAVVELITFPFVVLHDVVQPILPKKLLQGPPVRNIIHRHVSQARTFLSHSDFLPGTLAFCDRARWFSCSVLQDQDAQPSSRSWPTSAEHMPT